MLGPGWNVQATVGHFRDLPKKSLSVSRPDYALTYEISEGKQKIVKDLKAAAASADDIYVATDPDREGEAIAWHVEKVLGLKNPKRIEFHELTKSAILKAIAAPGRIDRNRVKAQEARRALDRLVGYEVSSALRNRTGQPMTAGRVQTIGVRLIVDREEEITGHVIKHHYGVVLSFDNGATGNTWTAEWNIKPLLPPNEKLWLDEAFAKLVAAIRNVIVTGFADTIGRSSPPSPYTTATLIQAAANKLRFGAKKTSALAQTLFEKSLITYHRSDSLNMSDEGFLKIQDYGKKHGLTIVAQKRTWKESASAQVGHEGIRPTSDALDLSLADARKHPDASKRATADEQALYHLIWTRAIASQMPDAIYDIRTLELQAIDKIDNKTLSFVAKGKKLKVAGFRALMNENATSETAMDDSTNDVPQLSVGKKLTATDGKLIAKKTEPPDRYTEASLVKALETRGVGRPSTYSSIVETIQARGYVEIKDRKFHPTETGIYLIQMLKTRFAFCEVQYTADMETHLDKVANGTETYLDVMTNADGQLQSELAAFGSAVIPGGGVAQVPCPTCGNGFLSRRISKKTKSAFWCCSNYKKDDAANSCKAIFNDAKNKPDFTPRAPRVAALLPCPKCGSIINKCTYIDKFSKAQKTFWACSKYVKGKPSQSCDAKFDEINGQPVLSNRVAAVNSGACPTCKTGKLMRRERKSDGTPFHGCSRWNATKNPCKAIYNDLNGKPDLDSKSQTSRSESKYKKHKAA